MIGETRMIDKRVITGLAIGAVATIALSNIIAAQFDWPFYLFGLAVAVGWLGITVTVLILFAAMASFAALRPQGFDNTWTRLNALLSSSAFYFFAGLGLLLYAIHTTQSQMHPSLTFLLAMLGMAIMLFGTGSQAVGSIATAGANLPVVTSFAGPPTLANGGSASTMDAVSKAASATTDAIDAALLLQDPNGRANALPSIRDLAATTQGEISKVGQVGTSPSSVPVGDWKPVKANAAIAGGAAVLTALFGWGVIHYRSDIKDVFGFYDRYVKIRIEACAAHGTTCGAIDNGAQGLIPSFTLEDYAVGAKLINGSPLYTIVSGNEVQLLVFSDAVDQNVPIQLTLKRTKPNSLLGPEIDGDIDLRISPKSFASNADTDPAVAAKPDQCDQYSSSVRVKCALNFEDNGNRGDEVYAILYSLNFFREKQTAAAQINKVDVDFQ
jgi:hypothetical protein